MAIKSFLSRAAAGTAARATSLVPLATRLKSSQAKLKSSMTLVADLKSQIATKERTRGDADNALKLSVDNEALAENRFTAAITDRDKASATSDLRTAENLSKRNRSTIQKADRKIAKMSVKLSAATRRQNQLIEQTDRLERQLKASAAAAPTRITVARHTGVRLVKASPAKIRAARKKVETAKKGFDSARADFFQLTDSGRKPKSFGSKRRRNKFK